MESSGDWFGKKAQISMQAGVWCAETRAKSISIPRVHEAMTAQASPCGAWEDDSGQNSSGMLKAILCTEQLRTYWNHS